MGAPRVVVLGYDAWQRSFGGREDVLGSVVNLGDTPAIVIGVMPKGFGYPVNHDMLAACVLACIGPARRALRFNPSDALREA